MSEYFQGITFANQNVSPVDDAVLRRRLLSDGVLTGCDLTYAGYTLTMAAGYLIACGRQIRRPTAENWAISDATSGYARVLMTIDLTRTATEEVFDQINTSIEYATAEDGFPALIQDDINATGSQYQVALAVVSLGTGGITGIVSKLELAASSGGGDGGLNFSVVGGTSQPESPKENTIWVNADTEITSWSFSATEPESPEAGMVWIATRTSSTVEFNALKKNSVKVYPISAKQYVSGAWVGKEAKIFQNGEWVRWFNREIYKNGIQGSTLVSLATGNHGYVSSVSGFVGRGSVVFGSDNISMTVPGSSADGASVQFVGTENTCPVSAFNKLIVEFSNLSVTNKNNANYVVVAVSPQKAYPGTVAGSASKTVYQNNSATTIEVDISAITEDAYIVITGVQYYAGSNVTAVIKKILLE